jgi:hypothetical protein
MALRAAKSIAVGLPASSSARVASSTASPTTGVRSIASPTFNSPPAPGPRPCLPGAIGGGPSNLEPDSRASSSIRRCSSSFLLSACLFCLRSLSFTAGLNFWIEIQERSSYLCPSVQFLGHLSYFLEYVRVLFC